MPHIFVIAGPNGAGKTTVSPGLLKQHLHVFEYVNADEIARGLNPLKPETANAMAGRVALERLQMLAGKRESFSFETTLAGQTHARFLRSCKDEGYQVALTFLWLPSPDMAIARVRNRMKQGGHSIPENVIRRRFHRGLANLLAVYLPVCDLGIILDSTKPAKRGKLHSRIAEKQQGQLIIHDRVAWNILVDEAKYG